MEPEMTTPERNALNAAALASNLNIRHIDRPVGVELSHFDTDDEGVNYFVGRDGNLYTHDLLGDWTRSAMTFTPLR
jgi:hypothetical protein